MRQLGVIAVPDANPKLTRLRKKSLEAAIGRRNRLPHRRKSTSCRAVGQALSPVERVFPQPLSRAVSLVSTSRYAHFLLALGKPNQKSLSVCELLLSATPDRPAESSSGRF